MADILPTIHLRMNRSTQSVPRWRFLNYRLYVYTAAQIEIDLDDEARYEGQMAGGVFNGKGVLSCADADMLYEGDWKDGKMHGHGVMSFASGSRYEGDWKDDEMHGHAVMSFPDGQRYKGECKDGKKNGHGVWSYPNGDRYEGAFQDDRFNGHGTMTYADGSAPVSGQWKDDKFLESGFSFKKFFGRG
eukprot:COSAG05_NODE_1269_length_5318_cov_3.679824_2_plen_188_part_00